MDQFDFKKCIDTIENNCPGKTYSEGERGDILTYIYRKSKPTADEMMEVISYLKEYYVDFLPGSGAIGRALTQVRKNRPHETTKKVPCRFNRCESTGFLAIEHPDADRYIIGCGCDNTPAWVPPEIFFANLLRHKLIKDSEVTTIKRQPIFDDKRKFKADRWEKIVQIYMNEKEPGTAFLPDWIRSRFDQANFDYPEAFPLSGDPVKPKMKTVDEVPF